MPIIATDYNADVGTAMPALNILNILGGEGIDTTGAGNTLTIIGELATAGINVGATNLGICSFDSADFTVTGGFVQIAATFGGIQTILTDSGAPAVLPDVGGQVSIVGGEGIDVTGQGPGNVITVTGELATAGINVGATNLGICSFNSAQFTVTGGFVQATGAVATTYTAENATIAVPVLGNLNIVGTATNGINTTAAGSTMTIAMASPYADGNFIFENNAAATPRALSVENNDNDPGSYAALAVSTEPGGGDAFVFWEIDAATRYYSMGPDNSIAGDPFKFTSSVSPSGGADIFSVDVGSNTFTHSYGNIIQTRAYVANGVNTIIQNTDNTNNASDAFMRLDVGGAAAGDPFIAFLITGAGKYAMGPDNSDFDYFKITDGNTPSDGTSFAVLNPGIYQWIFPVYEVTQQLTRIGQPIWHHIYNQDNTNGASEAYMQIHTGGATGGDPYLNFLVNGAGTYSVGIDNSVAGDPFKITSGANPSVGTDLFSMTSAGVITLNNDLDVTEGGTGVSTLTSHGILMGNGAGDIQATAEPSDGQILIGDTAGFPILGSITSLAGTITVTPGAGTINIETAGGIATTYTAEDASTASPALGNLNIVGTATNGINTTAAGSTITIAMASPYSDGNFTFTTATAAADRTVTISNTDNTAVYSAAHLQLTVGGTTTTGDPYINFLVTGGQTYSLGVDNSDSDILKFTTGATPSAASTLMRLTNSGNIYVDLGDFYTQRSAIGGIVESIVSNTDNTNAASNAGFYASTGGPNGGDAYTNYLISGAGTYSVGIDNSDSDKFKITSGTSPSAGTDLFTMTSAGVITLANDLDVSEGGTGVSTFTSHGILMGNGAGDIQATAEPSDGQLLIGDTGGFPILGSLASAGSTVAITVGAGTINLETGATVATTYTAENASTATPALNNLNIVGTATNGISTTAAGSTVTIAMASPYSDGDFTFTTATAGATRTLTVSNTDNTGANYSAAALNLSVGGTTTTGDPFVHWGITGGTEYAAGQDNSDSDTWKLVYGANPSTGTTCFQTNGGDYRFLLASGTQTAAPAAGTPVNFYMQNDTADPTSDVHFDLRTAAGGGDSYFQFGENTTPKFWCIGQDTSDTYALKINLANGFVSPSTGTNVFKITRGGAATIGVGGLTVDSGANAINIGADAAAKTITIGNQTGASSTIIDAGTGALNIGTAIAKTITIGNGTGATSVVVDCGTGALNLGANAIARTTTLGNTTGASVLALKYGTGDFTIASATGTVMNALDTGEITYPLQPAFLAVLGATIANATGNGTVVNPVIYDGEIYDQNADYNNGTGIFTAPVTGRCYFSTTMEYTDIAASMIGGIYLNTSNRSYYLCIGNLINFSTSGYLVINGSTYADMDAGDTAQIQTVVSGGAKVVDIFSAGNTTDCRTYFSGSLKC